MVLRCQKKVPVTVRQLLLRWIVQSNNLLVLVQPGSFVQQQKKVWDQRAADNADNHYKMLMQGRLAPGSDSEMVHVGAGFGQGNEEVSPYKYLITCKKPFKKKSYF